MWVRLQLDFGWWDLAYGMTRLFQPLDADHWSEAIEKRWSIEGHALATLSVRSGLDLLLGAMQWPMGSEIVYSALNIPDMMMVARQHGMVPVPADLDLERLAPNLELLEQAITPRTRAILIAHLYGNFVDMAPVADLARKHGLMLIEDCAENYDGRYRGFPEADVSLFSFGPLKTATALAGGVLRARDSALIARLKANHERWPRQTRADYFNRLCKYGTMKFFGGRWIYAETRKLARVVAGDVDKLIHYTAKSFRDDEIMRRLRHRPSGPLLASMARRLDHFDHERIRQRTENGKLLADLLRGHVFCPGADVTPHNYWLFPVLMKTPAKAIAALEAAGFDATQPSSMKVVEAPADRPELDPMLARKALEQIILVPCYPGIPEAELRRMAEVLIQLERAAARVEAFKITYKATDTVYGNGKTYPIPASSHADPALIER
jgi:perosamine synthetase